MLTRQTDNLANAVRLLVAMGGVLSEPGPKSGVAVYGETGIAVSLFTLGAGQGVFVTGLRMQEHREVLAHLPVAQRKHVVAGRAHHAPVALGYVYA